MSGSGLPRLSSPSSRLGSYRAPVQICHAVSRETERVINPIHLAGMRHGVKAKVQRSAPGVFDAEIAQLRIDLDHIASQNFCAALDCVAGLWKECGPASEQHAIIWR